MKLFISWSGDRSLFVARALHEWIPGIINDAEPWLSKEDIAKGAHWPSDLKKGLEESKFGIICLTPENAENPWVLFESGALWKAFGDARVCPYLLDLEPSEVRPPLGHFQASKIDKEDTWKLVRSINDAVKDEKGKFRTDEQLGHAFEVWWPKLEAQLRKVPAGAESKRPTRKDSEVLAEILETTRGVQREMSQIAGQLYQRPLFWPVSGSSFIVPGSAGTFLTSQGPTLLSTVLGSMVGAESPIVLESDSGKDKDQAKKEQGDK